jgi:hypothetical protein
MPVYENLCKSGQLGLKTRKKAALDIKNQEKDGNF